MVWFQADRDRERGEGREGRGEKGGERDRTLSTYGTAPNPMPWRKNSGGRVAASEEPCFFFAPKEAAGEGAAGLVQNTMPVWESTALRNPDRASVKEQK